MKTKNLLKTLALTIVLLVAGKVGWGQTSINFDTDANWIQDAAISLSSYGNHGYAEPGITFQGTNVLRNGTSVQDGFAGALGTYSFRLRNDASAQLLITVPSGGVSTFSFKVRRWDGSPMPDYTVQYSIDGGSNWESLSNIDGTLLQTSDWYTYNGTINNGNSNIIIKINNTGSTERIMIDDFTWTGYADSQAPQATFDPADGATNVAVDANITITFDEPIRNIDNSEITDANVASLLTLKETDASGADVAFTATIDAGKQVITITPNSNFANNQTYYVAIAPVEDASDNATSPLSSTFTTIDATAPTIALTYPNGGETFHAGDVVTITWTSANMDAENIKIEVYARDGQTPTWNWVEAISSTANDGSEDFTIPSDANYGTVYKIRVTGLTSSTADESDGTFTVISTPTINMIQSDNTAGASNYSDDIVKFSGIVTAVSSSNFFVQDGSGAWNGIYVKSSPTTVSVGDLVDVEGTVAESFDLTVISPVSSVNITSSGNALPDPVTLTIPEANNEQYESVLVKLSNVECSNADAGYGEYTLSDGTNEINADDLFFAYTPTLGKKYDITGILNYSFGAFKVEPRDASDIHEYSSDATLSTFTLGGQDAMGLANVSVADPVNDAGATMYVADFTGFAGIAATTTNGNATFSVTLNGTVVDPANYATQAFADGDVVVVTVTAEDGTMGYYKVTLTGENRSLTVTAPTGGETYNTGDVATILWTSANITNVNIYAEDASTSELYPIAANVDATLSTFDYTIQNGDFGTVYIRVADAADETFYDNSDGTVTVNDNVAPSITDRYPALDAADVPVSFTLSITFDEDVQDGSNGALEIRKTSDNSVVISKSFADLTHQDDNLTLDVSGLEYSTSYYVTIPAGFVVDMSTANGNAEVAANAWTFTTGAAPVGDLFFSEYIEGSGSNKAIEIYNPTDYDIALSGYMLKGTANDASDWEYDYPFPDGAVVPAHGTYVIVDDQADAAMLAVADWVSTGFECGFNGNDARGLFKFNGTDYDLIDVIGNPNNPAGDNYSVAGVADATVDHTLIRKTSVFEGNPDWTVSAGTTSQNSEWVVNDIDYFDDLGTHSFVASSENDIISFTLPEQTGPATIDNTNHTVDIEVAYGTDVTSLVPTIEVSLFASITPESGVSTDFTSPVTYTVTAQDGTTQDWLVKVTVASSLSSEKDIVTFEISGQLSVDIDANAATVNVVMPYGTDLSNLTPTITVSPLASIDPASGVAQDFNNPVNYTVTAEDGTQKVWTVTVTVQELTLISIYDIQYTTDASGDSPYVGQQVRTRGIVTAVKTGTNTFNMVIQDSAKAWNGVYVYGVSNGMGPVNPGDSVEIVAEVSEYYNLTEIKNVVSLTIINKGNDIPAPVEVSISDANTEAYEGVLIKVSNAECVTEPDQHGDWKVSDGTNELVVSDLFFAYTPTLNAKYNITGVLDFSYGNYKIQPRDENDIESAETKYTVTFTVKRTDGTTPVDGATIIVTGQGDLTTDASGQATMQLPNGDYTFIVLKDGFNTYNGSFTVADADKVVEVTLVPTGVPVNTLAKLIVYPNPFTTRINFEGAEVTRVTVTSVIGQVVLDQIVENARSIDLSNIEKGIYLVRFYNNKGESVLRKLIKE
jgi:predicted extracellular nuclease